MAQNELDLLMDLDPLNLSAADLDAIISYHRAARAKRAEGSGRAVRESGPKVNLDAVLKNIGVGVKAPGARLKRRV